MASDKGSDNIVISSDAVVLSSGGKKGKGSSNIVIKDSKPKKCTCCIEHVEHWGWIDSWQPQEHWGGWNQHSKKQDHWKQDHWKQDHWK